MVATVAMAHDFEVGGIYYNILSEEKKTVGVTFRGNSYSSYSNEYSGSVVIPQSVTYNGSTYSVTSIGNYAFGYCTGLTSVTIPISVTSIGIYAFSGCDVKKAIWLTNTPPTGYKYVGAAINYVANDKYSDFSNVDVKVYPYLSSLFEVGGIKYVPVSPAERTCDAIDCVYDSTAVDINIEKTVLFKGIAMNVKHIMPYTFYAYKNIKTIKVENDGIVGSYAFCNCSALSSATISNNGCIDSYAFSDCSSLVTATLGDSIASIGAYAFYGCSKLSGIVIPDAVTAIGSKAFKNCKSLETVKVGNGTKNIDSYAFDGCSALSSITLGDSVTTIEEFAFYTCSSLPEIVIPQSVTKIDSYAFNGCTALADVIIEDRTTALSLGSNGSSPLFSDCPLNSVYIGGKITYNTSISYGYSPFYRNTSLRSVVITDTEEVYDNEFNGCSSLVTATLGGSIASIGAYAFYGCSKLSEIVIPDAVTEIGSWAFSDCTSLETVKVGNGTKSIDSYAFYGCSALSSVTLGDNVATIGGYAFYACSSLPEIVIPQSVTNINNYAFNGCTALADVIIEDRTTALSLGSNGSSPLFSDCPLDSVYIGGRITYKAASTYGYSPFYRNTSLRSVVITDTEEEVYYNEFYGCSNLKNVSIGNGVKKIGDWAFSGCSSLDYFAFGKSVQSIGKEAFSDCNNVTQIISHAKTPPTCGAQALDDINKWNCTLWVPEKYKAEYQSAEQWKGFFFIEGIAAQTYTVTFIVDGEVYDTLSVEYGEKITLPDTPVKEGHTFSGWSEAPETMPAEDIVIEGSFSVNSYTITYKVDGEVYATDSIAYGSEIVLRDEPVKEGHTFSGWNEAPETMPAEDIVIEGSFSVNSYSITYKVDGEVYATDSIAYGCEIVLRDEPTKEGHTFSGWSDVPETMPANDITIEGTFSINSYTVTFMIDGEVYETATVEFGAEIELPTPPEKEGYIFGGWVGVPDSMPAQDVVIEGEYIVDTTGINDVKTESSNVKTIYDLQGRVVENPTSGIYIINGKKVVIK